MAETCLTEFKNNKISFSERSLPSYLPLCPSLQYVTVMPGGNGYTKVFYCKECKKELHVHDY